VVNLAKTLFLGAYVGIFKRNDKSVDVRINSRRVSDFLHGMGVVPHRKRVPQWVRAERRFIKTCLRGLFDTEGSISFKRYMTRKGISIYPQLNFKNANIELVQFVRDSLLSLGFKPTKTLKRSLYISNQHDVDRFRQEIGFSNPKLLTRSMRQKV
jgi:intein/homing endonuclease